ncbi:hypothetical protein BR93DRAFT_886442 [Coniochaeta sp. PMI_546]|nr:hypothetical protein BR93DRAFT_886442 [Coniochaeta sp. PMI_546]
MEPFVYLVEYPFVICIQCKFGYVTDEVSTYLRVRYSYIKPKVRKIIYDKV